MRQLPKEGVAKSAGDLLEISVQTVVLHLSPMPRLFETQDSSPCAVLLPLFSLLQYFIVLLFPRFATSSIEHTPHDTLRQEQDTRDISERLSEALRFGQAQYPAKFVHDFFVYSFLSTFGT